MFNGGKEYEKLAKNLVEFSVDLKKGERVLLNAVDVPDDMIVALLHAIDSRGGIPVVRLQSNKISRALNKILGKDQMESFRDVALDVIKKMDAFIAIRGGNNIFYQSDIPHEQRIMIDGVMRPVHDWRVKNTKWVILRWPTDGFAQQAKMSTDAFEEFFFRVCTLDYAKMIPGMEALTRRM
ncbi:MAG: aminopeptidase, partial [Puniceicoccales bacterium]|nr:aminopeptidase [Puniceicoccales bacterium]